MPDLAAQRTIAALQHVMAKSPPAGIGEMQRLAAAYAAKSPTPD